MERAVRQMELKMDKFDKRIQNTEGTVMNMEKSVDCEATVKNKEKRSDNARWKTVYNIIDEVKKENDELKHMLFEMRRLNNELTEETLDI